MSAIVADASCLAAALIASDEAGPWAAEVLRTAASVHVPYLAHVEVLSRLLKAELRGLGSAEAVEVAVRGLMELPVQVWPLEGLHTRVWELRHNVTPYDGWYVALAEYLEIPLATCDTRLTRANGPTCAFIAFH